MRRINSIRQYPTKDATKTLINSCILSRLDYCSPLLASTVIKPLKQVQNFVAKLIFKIKLTEKNMPNSSLPQRTQ